MKRIIKCLALAIACLQMTVCFGCSNSDKSEKKSSSSKSKSSGFDSPDEAIEAYLKAFIDNDADAVYNTIYSKEVDMFLEICEEFLDEKHTESDIISIVKEELADCHEGMSNYPIDEWKMNYEFYEDFTDEFLMFDMFDDFDDDFEYREAYEKMRKEYDKMNLQKVYTYDSVYLINDNADFVEELFNDDIACMQFDDKWYISILNLDL